MARGDIFISYSSKDKEWAEKLEQSLASSGKSVFRDVTRLTSGRPFEEQLYKALDESSHMVAFWSASARDSDWVSKEMGYFHVKFWREKNKTLTIIVLEDEPKAYQSLHFIYDVKSASAYETGAHNIDIKIWNKVIERTLNGINSTINGPQQPIQRLFLTLTTKDLPNLNYTEEILGEKITLQEFLDRTELTGKLDLIYGDTWRDWKTIDKAGKAVKFTDRMDTLLLTINNEFKTNFGWQDVPETFFEAARPEIERQINLLVTNPSVIVVDPIALFYSRIRSMFERLQKCFRNKNSLIITYSITDHSEIFNLIRNSVGGTAITFHDKYFNPPIPRGDVLAQISANPNDELDVRRKIQSLIADLGSNNTTSSVYTST